MRAPGTLAEPALPPDILADMERLNTEAAPLNIWLRTRANAPQKTAWHRHADEPAAAAGPIDTSHAPPPVYRPAPCLWRWADIHPYLLRIAEIAPLEFTDRQQFLLLNPGLGGALRVTNTIRVAVSIYKPGDVAATHRHTPNASRTILSREGGYTTVEGERCAARRGDLILTPNGTWHGHGNDGDEPVMWMDVLDWPLLETLDCIWIEADEDAARAANSAAPSPGWSRRHYGAGGMAPTFVGHRRGTGQGNSPLLHYSGAEIRRVLEDLAGEDGDAYEGIRMAFTNPATGGPVFTTLGYSAQLLRPGEETRPKRETASTLYCCLAGRGYSEIAGARYDWSENDIFVVPNHLWRRHGNSDETGNAILYAVSDAPLLQKIGHYRAQGKTRAGAVVELEE